MNVVSNIEVAPQGIAKPGQSQMPAGLREAGSFKSNWQTLLASIGANGDGIGDGERGAKSATLKPNGPEPPVLGKSANPQTQPGQIETGKHAREMNDTESSTGKHADVKAKIAKSQTSGSESGVGTNTLLAGISMMAAPVPAFAVSVVSSAGALKENLADETSGTFQARSMNRQIEGRQHPFGQGGAANAIANRSSVIAAGGAGDSGRTSLSGARETDSATGRTTQAVGQHASGDVGSQQNHHDEMDEPDSQGSPLTGDQAAAPVLGSTLKEDGSGSLTGTANSLSAGIEPSLRTSTHAPIERPHADGLEALTPVTNQVSNSEMQTVSTTGSGLGSNSPLANAPLESNEAVQTVAMAPIAGKRGSLSSVRGPGHIGSSANAESNSVHLAQPGSISIAGQTGSSPLDDGRFSRGLGGDSVAGNVGHTDEGESVGLATQPGHETFAALDAGSLAGAPGWVHAGAHQAEAGFQDPALGWVGVRADGSGAGVHAALLPGSADAAVTLGGHLSGLNAYLTEHRVQVEPVTVAAPENQSTGAGFENAAGQNTQHGSGQGSGQETESATQPSAPVSVHADSGLEQGNEVPGRMMDTAAPHANGSMHISIMV